MKALDDLQQEIKAHCISLKRDPLSVRLIVATKYFTVEQIKELYQLGLRDFGENRVQEALLKIEQLPKDIRWHFFAHVQKNKVHKIKDRFFLIHSIDSFEIAEKISLASSKVQRVLLQIKTSDEESKTGFSIEVFKNEFSKISQLKNLQIKGLMTLAKKGSYEESLKAFKVLADLKKELGQKDWELSMGMSEDFKAAIEAGSTYLRIGSRLL